MGEDAQSYQCKKGQTVSDKLPALPARPKSFRAKTFDPYDDVFGYAETKGRMDAQDARIAELEKDRDAWKELCNLESKEVEELERELREATQLLTRSKDSTSSQILYRDIVQWERNAERKNDDV